MVRIRRSKRPRSTPNRPNHPRMSHHKHSNQRRRQTLLHRLSIQSRCSRKDGSKVSTQKDLLSMFLLVSLPSQMATSILVIVRPLRSTLDSLATTEATAICASMTPIPRRKRKSTSLQSRRWLNGWASSLTKSLIQATILTSCMTLQRSLLSMMVPMSAIVPTKR